jgi:hypothetical protein
MFLSNAGQLVAPSNNLLWTNVNRQPDKQPNNIMPTNWLSTNVQPSRLVFQPFATNNVDNQRMQNNVIEQPNNLQIGWDKLTSRFTLIQDNDEYNKNNMNDVNNIPNNNNNNNNQWYNGDRLLQQWLYSKKQQQSMTGMTGMTGVRELMPRDQIVATMKVVQNEKQNNGMAIVRSVPLE